MKFTATGLDGAYLLEWEPRSDERGFFAETRSNSAFATHGLNNNLTECSLSFNHRRGTLRGMHYQVAPSMQNKLVSCIRGRVFDAIVDLRPDSKTYLKSFGAELSLDNRQMLYVPQGVAHGFVTLEEQTIVQYQIGGDYAPEAARGVRWNDPSINIEWPLQPAVIADRDRDYEDFLP